MKFFAVVSSFSILPTRAANSEGLREFMLKSDGYFFTFKNKSVVDAPGSEDALSISNSYIVIDYGI